MAKKNETPILIVSMLITLGLLGGGIWWFLNRANLNLGGIVQGGNTSGGVSSPTSGNSGNAPNTGGNAANLVSVANFSEVPNVPSGLFPYGGSTTWAPIRSTVDSQLQQAQPQFQLRYTDPVGQPPGSSVGVQMLLDGQLAFSQSSTPLSNEQVQQAEQRGFTLQQIPVAIEGVAIAVHHDLQIPGLTIDQLRNIYTGQITNWSQVGGPNLPIIPLTRQDSGGTVEFFVSTVLGGAGFGGSVQQVGTTTQALRQVAATPGAIYYASAPEIVGQCGVRPLPLGLQPNQLVPPYQEPYVPPEQCPNQRNQINLEALQSGQYPITRTLFVIIKQNGQTEQQAGEAYANLLRTEQAATLLSGAGFVPLR